MSLEAAATLGLDDGAGEGAMEGRVRATGRRPALAVGVGAATVALGTSRAADAVTVGVRVVAGVDRSRLDPAAGVLELEVCGASEGLTTLCLTGDLATGFEGEIVRRAAVPAALEVAAEREAADDTLLILAPLVGLVFDASLTGLSLDEGVEDTDDKRGGATVDRTI